MIILKKKEIDKKRKNLVLPNTNTFQKYKSNFLVNKSQKYIKETNSLIKLLTESTINNRMDKPKSRDKYLITDNSQNNLREIKLFQLKISNNNKKLSNHKSSHTIIKISNKTNKNRKEKLPDLVYCNKIPNSPENTKSTHKITTFNKNVHHLHANTENNLSNEHIYIIPDKIKEIEKEENESFMSEIKEIFNEINTNNKEIRTHNVMFSKKEFKSRPDTSYSRLRLKFKSK